MTTATLLLPARRRLGAQLPNWLARVLGRADTVPDGGEGERAQLLRHFDLLPRGWPAAALTRSRDATDVASAQWLRADPAWIRPDINGARMFACGEGMQLTREDVDALLPALRTLFGDAGFPIDAPDPSRWYLRLPEGAPLPSFPDPEDALGADLVEIFADVGDAGMRRWRVLLNEAQVVLHNHPWNERRASAGKPPVNSLWLWGGGRLPDRVATAHAQVGSGDALLQSLAANAGVPVRPLPRRLAPGMDGLWDLRDARDPATLDTEWLQPAHTALMRREVDRLQLDFADGNAYLLSRSQRWRFWRKPA